MASLSLTAARDQIAARLSSGDASGALNMAQQLAAQFPNDYRTALLRGRAQLAFGNREAALAEFERTALVAPDEQGPHEGLSWLGSESARQVLADLPPLLAGNGERPPISTAALGHLYLRQLMLTHCTAQLGPVWQAQPARLDVGVALAEAHWRLSEQPAVELICRSILSSAPYCLKANLLLAQVLWSSGDRSSCEPLLDAAQAADPENDVAEELYEWLIVRDPELVPLRHREVTTQLDEGTLAEASIESQPVELVPEAIATVADEAPADQDRWDSGVEELSATPAEPAAADETFTREGWTIEPVAEEPSAEPFAEEASAGIEPVAYEDQAAAGEGLASEPDIAETSPEPALAEIEAHAASPVDVGRIDFVEMSGNGQLSAARVEQDRARASVVAWYESCNALQRGLALGNLRASSIDTAAGALQLLHDQDEVTVAFARPGTNLGLVRSRLRQRHHSSEEHDPH